MIGIGVIGCGSISIFRHVPEYYSRSDCKLVGYYDPLTNRAQSLADKYGGKVFNSLEELLADKDIDAVSVCTSNKYHASITIDALKAGKHVLCEKPMATSEQEAQDMINTAHSTGKFLMIGHNQRLAPAHLRAKEILKSGELGNVLTFRTTFGHGGPEYWSQDKGRHTWFFKYDDAFIGAMGDLGVHKADLIRWLIDDEIIEAKAYVTTLHKTNEKDEPIEVDDNAICLLKSKTGIFGTLTASWTYYGAEDNSTVLYCTNGIMKIYDNPEFPIEVKKINGEKVYYKVGRIQTNQDQSSSGVIDMFIEGINSGKEPEINGEEGLAALRIVLACLESAKTGKSVFL
ncbi:MAG: Gfo/Idh/MocA family oxidoreductase [Clostridiaceae bacterium]|jgi:UDP-N-acetylglucosamine 3-dehydrogenase|nr:Gfo/Idh/MocA family oxidoreductase [Clostridiaceae bacterium]